MLPPEGGNREVKVQRLAVLEKEAQKLRSLLGLEITKTTQGTMTTADGNAENPEEGPVKPVGCKEVGCQTSMAEVSTISNHLF